MTVMRYDITMDQMVPVTQEDWDRLEKEKHFFQPLRDIRQFHEKFQLQYDGPPRDLPAELKQFRVKFLAEELCEYVSDSSIFHQVVASAFLSEIDIRRQPLEKQLDALVDLMYVLLGTSYLQGFDFKEAWNRVHETNMTKIRALTTDESRRESLYDVVKPEGFRPPDLSDLVDTSRQS